MLPDHQDAGECRKLQHLVLASYAAPKSAMGGAVIALDERLCLLQ